VPASFILQAGAFSSEEEADNLRARLALMGLESSVQPHAVAGKDTLYRVRLGPFATMDDSEAGTRRAGRERYRSCSCPMTGQQGHSKEKA
jgi:cell division protein FtsN